MTREEKEFLDKLKNRCDSLGIDINIVGKSDLLLLYNGTTFYMEYYIYNNKLEVPLSIVSMNIKGKEYGYETYSFVDVDYTDSYDTVNNAVEEITDIVVNSNNRRKALKVINSFESFTEDMKQDDLDILLSYIKNNYISQLSSQEAEYANDIIEMQTEIKKVEAEILTAATLNSGYDYVGGEMAWPVPGHTRITSNYGMRTHPITGVYKLHTGVDISASIGDLFIAANDGVVAKAEYNTAYGNMVLINHGGGVSTLYAHGSEILVQVGQEVKRGDEVLKVGSTGYSTGPHAHFEVRVNGQCVNPMPYITTTNN